MSATAGHPCTGETCAACACEPLVEEMKPLLARHLPEAKATALLVCAAYVMGADGMPLAGAVRFAFTVIRNEYSNDHKGWW